MGLLWALVALLFLIATWAMLGRSDRWWIPALAGVVLSQVLIVLHWQDARIGTLANILLLVVIALVAVVHRFRQTYHQDALEVLQVAMARSAHILEQEDLVSLPAPVQRFLRKGGHVGRPVPRSLNMEFTGDIRSKHGPWMPFRTEQFNTFDPPARLFWMNATMKALPTKGYHRLRDGHASMRIKVLGLLPVIETHGPELDTAELVTWFNDLCLFAPARLADPTTTWHPVDDRSAMAMVEHNGIRISATLLFDDQDRLVDFVRDDRYYLGPDGRSERRRFHTPVSGRSEAGGLGFPADGEVLFVLDDGPFTYIRLHTEAVAYDVVE
ncbi:MAG: hypothetical protein IT227_15605 [Flavobacteriales bacterium]|jgi:hypothetical protein|nr:hypothetical protein [Flavobacteriales bacterium]